MIATSPRVHRATVVADEISMPDLGDPQDRFPDTVHQRVAESSIARRTASTRTSPSTVWVTRCRSAACGCSSRRSSLTSVTYLRTGCRLLHRIGRHPWPCTQPAPGGAAEGSGTRIAGGVVHDELVADRGPAAQPGARPFELGAHRVRGHLSDSDLDDANLGAKEERRAEERHGREGEARPVGDEPLPGGQGSRLLPARWP
jgi:hypothetical protein